MRSIVKQFSEVKGITFLQARNSGRFIFVYINLSLSLKRLRAAHEIINNIEREIKSRIPCVERVIIHYEPERKEYQRSAVPLANREGEISEHFGRDSFITLWDKRNSDAEFLRIIVSSDCEVCVLIVWINIFSLLGSVGSVGGATLLLVFPEGGSEENTFSLSCQLCGRDIASGAAFLGMIPHALDEFLRQFPSVGRAQAIAALELAKESVMTRQAT